MNENQFDALEQALVELAAGKDAATLITANPEIAVEIETVQWASTLSVAEIPGGAAHRSRTLVLARAMQLRSTGQPSGWGFRRIPRLAFALILVLMFLLSWNGLVFASAKALPGDQLYPAKLTLEKLRLSLTLNPQTHQTAEEEFQARRIDEVARLLALGRTEFVQFVGMVEELGDDYWIVDGIDVRILPETIILGDILPGITVEIEGSTQPSGWVEASEIHLQSFSFSGTVESISRTVWIISGQEVLIDSSSIMDSNIEIGDLVIVEVTADDFGTLTARSITIVDSSDFGPLATETPMPLKDMVPEPPIPSITEERDETDEPEETEELDGTDEPDETDERKDSTETDEPDETDEPEETDEPAETNEHDEKENPDERDKPDEPEEP